MDAGFDKERSVVILDTTRGNEMGVKRTRDKTQRQRIAWVPRQGLTFR